MKSSRGALRCQLENAQVSKTHWMMADPLFSDAPSLRTVENRIWIFDWWVLPDREATLAAWLALVKACSFVPAWVPSRVNAVLAFSLFRHFHSATCFRNFSRSMSRVLATSDAGMVFTFEPALNSSSISAFVRLSPGPVLSPANRAWMLSSAACNAFNFVNDWSSPVNVAFGYQRRGQRHHPVLPTFRTADTEGALFEAHILDAQVQWFTHPQPATIKHASDQIGWVTAFILDGAQKRLGFRHRGSMAFVNRSLSSQGVNVDEGVSQHLLVEVKERIESLVLGAGGYVVTDRLVREEVLHFLLAGEGFRHVA